VIGIVIKERKEWMRIGILTASHTNNNGTDIQAYAMQEIFLSELREVDSVEIINYRCPGLERNNRILKNNSLSDILHIPQKILNKLYHNLFRKKYFKFSSKRFSKYNISDVVYDLIVVGSDQLWNLKLTDKDYNFYLDFETNCKKYSYAVSFGHSDLQKFNEEFHISSILKHFSCVSVRETSSIEQLKKINVKSRHDLDPILMLTDEMRTRIETVPQMHKEYVLLYFIKLNYEAIEWAQKYASKYDVEIILISDSLKKFQGIKCINSVSVEKWTGYIKNAKLVITNSYHGLSYSIVSQTDFYYVDINNAVQENNRMIDLLDYFCLKNRIWNKNLEIQDVNVNWDYVNNKLRIKRKESQKYIQKILGRYGD
jgi:hypothetical protein